MPLSKCNETRVLFAAAQRIRKEKLERITKYTNSNSPQSPLARRRLANTSFKDCIIVEQAAGTQLIVLTYADSRCMLRREQKANELIL